MTRWARLVFLSLASLLLLGEGALARDSCVTLYSVTHLQSQLLPVKIGEKKAGTFVGDLTQTWPYPYKTDENCWKFPV